MYLRKLELKDAPLMLAWMHDKSVTEKLQADFASKTIDDAESFIKMSWDNKTDLHLAIASDTDEYMGTVSLKHIENGSAEFAITVRAESMGKGYSWFGMENIIEKAFNELNLESVYWCVSRDNPRAVRFYDKHNFHEALDIPDCVLERYKGMDNLKWYSVLKGDDFTTQETVAGCKVVHIKTIPTVDAGELSFFEASHDIPFEVKRIYYITKVPEGVRRGFHAHNELLEMLTLFVIFLVFETLASNSIQLWSGRRRFDYVYKPVVAMTLGMSVANTIVSIVLVLLSEQKGYARIVGHVVTYLCFGLIVFTLNTLRGKKLFEKNI